MHYLLVFFSCLFIRGYLVANNPVLIMSHHYNRPDFIELQYVGFKRYLKDEYQFVVFNDATHPDIKIAIEETCARLNIPCIRIPQEIHSQPYLYREPTEGYHDPAVRNSNVVQYSLHQLGFKHKGIVLILDSDMFLIKDFSIHDFMKDSDIAGVPQCRGDVRYIWIGLAFLDFARLPNKEAINFNCGRIRGFNVDAGGYTALYLEQHPLLRVQYFPGLHIENCLALRKKHICFEDSNSARVVVLNSLHSRYELTNYELYLNNTFFHYRSGSNWDWRSQEYHVKKTKAMNLFLEDLWQAGLQ